MDLGRKLQTKPGDRVLLVAVPPDVDAGLFQGVKTVEDPGQADAVLAFAIGSKDLDSTVAPALDAARADRLAWIAYPKAGQLGTDLNRDRLAAAVQPRGVRPVRQVSIDDVWSALRFRPR